MPEVCLLFSKEVLATDENSLHFRARLVAIRFPSGCPYHPALHVHRCLLSLSVCARHADALAVSIANMELENTGNDILNVFGAGSPEASEAASNFSQATK